MDESEHADEYEVFCSIENKGKPSDSDVANFLMFAKYTSQLELKTSGPMVGEALCTYYSVHFCAWFAVKRAKLGSEITLQLVE